jgi:hypothetical protein
MGIIKIPSGSLLRVTKSCGYANTGSTLNVGNAVVAAINTTGSSIDSLLNNVADISSPSAWTTLVSITGMKLICINGSTKASIVVDGLEGSGDSLRMQILIDGETIWDGTSVKDVSSSYVRWYPCLADANVSIPIFCESSFLIRACRKGSFTDAGTSVNVGEIRAESVVYV